MKRITSALAVLLGSLALAGCGGSDGSTSEAEPKASMNLGITDAPVDSAEHVVVQFTGVELVPGGEDDDAAEEGNEAAEGNGPNFVTFIFDEPMTIDLLAVQGSDREFLLQSEEIPAGTYSQIRLMVQAEQDGVLDSYIEVDGEQHELFIPSGAQTGLKLEHVFTVAADTVADYTIDFDLRQSVVFAPGRGYILKPVLRLVETERAGAIAGIIDPIAFEGLECSEQPEDGYAVYVYAGPGASPDDLGSSTEENPTDEPITSSGVALDQNSQYAYEAGFLDAGEYTVAATCTADADDPEADDDIVFVGAADVSVSPGATTPHDFR